MEYGFTDIDDVVSYVCDADSAFREELTPDAVRAIVRKHRVNRYERITMFELDLMIAEAYAACGAGVPR
jgi:hypothetical protein